MERFAVKRTAHETARSWLLCGLMTALVIGSGTAASSDNLCEGFNTDKERVKIPAVAKPPFRSFYRDPAFGSKIIRITNAAEGEVFKPAYSTMQAWNADESLLLIYRAGANSAHLLLDGHTYEFVRQLDVLPADLEEIFWSHTDPDVFYYVSKFSGDYGEFKRYSVSEGKATTVRDFKDVCGKRGLPTAGNDVQMHSLDDDLFGFRCQRAADDYVMFTWRPSTDEVHAVEMGEGTDWQPWTAPIPGPSGERVWQQMRVLTPELDEVVLKHDMYKYTEHSNIGLTHDGHDAVFTTAFDPSPNGCNEDDLWQGVGHLVVHDMETGDCRAVINEDKGYPYTTSGTHISAQAWQRPGWVLLSSIGYGSFEFFTNDRRAPALISEIYLANTDPRNEVVCRIAHHRSYGKSAQNGGYKAYFGEPHATISPSGTRVVFGSDWYDSGSVDTYVIELPGYERPAEAQAAFNR